MVAVIERRKEHAALGFARFVERWMAANPDASPDDLAVALLPHLFRSREEDIVDEAVIVGAAALATVADLIGRARGAV